MASLLLKSGTNPDLQLEQGRNPLLEAPPLCDPELVEVLVKC